jgi:hypothetical protein
MTVRLGVFLVPDASDPDTTVEGILAADRVGLDLVGVQDPPTSADSSTPGPCSPSPRRRSTC